MPVQQDGGALGGGAPRVVWLTSESDPRLVSARSVAADLARESRPAHLVWNPGSGEVVQQVPIVRAARALNGRAGREGRICAQIMVVGRAREPFTAGLLAGLEEIMRWLDSWGVPRRWPAGPPLPSPQSYHSGRSRRDWARGGHYGACQVPGLSRPDPGGIDIDRITVSASGMNAIMIALQALVDAGHVALAVVAVLFSLIGAFYYLRVVKVVYFDEPQEDAGPIQASCASRGLMSVNGLLVLLLGVLPGGLMTLCVQAIARSLSF